MSSAEWFRWAAAFFLGALSTIAIEFVRGQFERRQRRQDQRDDFQRQTLLDLQDGLLRLFDAVASIRTARQHEQRATGSRKLNADHPGKANARREVLRARALKERIEDQALRIEIGLLLDWVVSSAISASAAEPDSPAWEAWLYQHRATNEGIGELLRKL